MYHLSFDCCGKPYSIMRIHLISSPNLLYIHAPVHMHAWVHTPHTPHTHTHTHTQDMIHIADTKVARRYGDFFIRQIHKLEEVCFAHTTITTSPCVTMNDPCIERPASLIELVLKNSIVLVNEHQTKRHFG